MDSSLEEKQRYIQENIANKCLDSYLFVQFLQSKSNSKEYNLENHTMGELKKIVEEFTQQQNKTNPIENPAPLTNNKTEKKPIKNIFESILGIKNSISEDSSTPLQSKPEKTTNYDYGFNLPETLKCNTIEETPLGREEEAIVKITSSQKIDKGIFSKTITLFTITAIPLGKTVQRSFEDFEWLRKTLIKIFDSNFIPSLPKINPLTGIENDEECQRQLEKFLNFLLLDPLIKNSQILFDFLSIEQEKEFRRQQKDHENITPCNDIQEFKSLTGEIDINFTDEKEQKMQKIKEFLSKNSKLFDKLIYNLKSLYVEMKNVIKRMDDITTIWGELFQLSDKYKDDLISKGTYSQMNNIFFNLNNSFKQQNEFFNLEIKENFIFMYNNYDSINELIKRCDKKKSTYFREEKNLMELKKDLFITRNTPEHKEKNADIIVNKEVNGSLDLSNLLPINTQSLREMKTSYGFYLNRFLTEYERMKKLNRKIYKEKIQKCYNIQNQIISELCACIQSIISNMDLYNCENGSVMVTPQNGMSVNFKEDQKDEQKGDKKEDKKDDIKEDNKDKKDDNENNVNIINNINIEDSGFNIINDDNDNHINDNNK